VNAKWQEKQEQSHFRHLTVRWVRDTVIAVVQQRVIKEPLLFLSTSSSEAIRKCDIAEAVSFRPSVLTSLILHLLTLSDISKSFSVQKKIWVLEAL